MRQLAYVWLVAMVAACNRGTPAPASVPKNRVAHDDCTTTSAALAKVLTPPGEEATHPDLEATFARRCSDDRWTPEARNCLTAARIDDAVSECTYKHLTQEQADKFAKVLPSDPSTRRVMAKMTELKDKMCACADPACAQQVSDEMTRWSQEMSKEQRKPPKLSDAEIDKFAEIGEQMGQCMQKAMSPAGP